MRIRPVILSGGAGTRLWPTSRQTLPKQFIEFPHLGSLFESTLKRANFVTSSANPLVVSGRQYGFLCRQAAQRSGVPVQYILEEVGRNTGPAIYFAARACKADDILLIMPSDHWIEDIESFNALVQHGVQACEFGAWVTFGINPTSPATGYGYIEAQHSTTGPLEVRSFTEKPDIISAKKYASSGRHFWNSGIFMIEAAACLQSFHRHQPDLAKASEACWQNRISRGDEDILRRSDLEAVPDISVDYALLEKEDQIKLLPFDGSWSDVGSWDSLSNLIKRGSSAPSSGAVLVDSKNVFIHRGNRTIAGIGIEDLIIIDDVDATLIVKKGHAEKVKKVLQQLVNAGDPTAIEHKFEYRPWGMFENLLESKVCKVKRLSVDPGQHLSLQYHHKRSEHWVVVEGTATVQLDDRILTLEVGEAIDIPLGAHHALGNDTDALVVVIEVQMGSYFGEDDIVRLKDPYGR